jgi:hypothetical protein
MIDIQEFGRRYREKLMDIAAESRGVHRIEAVRKYHTDAGFHAMIDTLAQTAIQVITDMEQIGGSPFDRNREEFQSEAAGLLGWAIDTDTP